MAEYLEKEAFKLWAKHFLTNSSTLLDVIDRATPADVEPVRHGYWDDSFDGITPYCSVCRMSHRCLMRTPDYCPNCGAKMDEDTKC